jgi:site-specific DNA recombinase
MSNLAAIYARSSKDRSDVSIDAQRRALHELAGARGLIVVAEFADAVESGKDDNRPGFQQLITALRDPARKWTHVLALDTARIGRRRLVSMIFEAELEKRGVKIIYRSLPDADPATDMIIRSIMQAFDEYHSLISKAKGLAGMAENVRQGWRAGGRAPRGYKLAYTPTGASRDGSPVLKSKLQIDEDAAPQIADYLRLRASGVPRGDAAARSGIHWPATSLHSLDWQSLTYAGHTAWNVHTEPGTGEKRRPRREWLITRDTHPALITDAEAEAVLQQMERLTTGRRAARSELIFAGFLVSNGQSWHSDGCGYYRLGKGKKVLASRIEPAILERIKRDLLGENAVENMLASVRSLKESPPPRKAISALERRLSSLSVQIGRTVDLAGKLDDPTPVLRRVEQLETERASIVEQLVQARSLEKQVESGKQLTHADVRTLLSHLFAGIDAGESPEIIRAEISKVLERVELDPVSLAATLHYSVAAGVNLASPRQGELSPAKWAGQPFDLGRKRA